MTNLSRKACWKILWLLGMAAVYPAFAAEDAPPQQSRTQAQEKPALHALSNENLLAQAAGIFNQADRTLRMEMRALAKEEFLLEQARQARDALQLPETPAVDESLAPLEQAERETETAKAYLAARREQLELMRAVETGLDYTLEQINATRPALDVLADSIDGLDLFLFEIRLRTQDGTLAATEVPPALAQKQLTARRDELATWRTELEDKQKQAQEDLEALQERLETAQAAVNEAEAAYDAAKKTLAREQKRRSVEQEYSGRSAESLVAILEDMQEELAWLNGAFEFSRQRFQAGEAEAEALQRQLEAAEPPAQTEAEALQEGAVIEAEQAEQATQNLQALMEYHTTHKEQLERQQTLLRPVIENSAHFQGDAAVLSEHLFKMQVVAGLLDKLVEAGALAADAVPPEARAEALDTRVEGVSSALSQARAASELAKQRQTQNEQAIEHAASARREAEARLEQVQEHYQASQEAQEWETKLKNLSAAQIVEEFEADTKLLQTNAERRADARREYEEAKVAAKELQAHFDSLKDSLLRSVDKASAEEKQTILKKLYSFADLELPPELQAQAAPAEAPAAAPEQTASAQTRETAPAAEKTEATKAADKAPEPESPKPAQETEDGPQTELGRYQKLLSTHAHILEEQRQSRAERLTALRKLDELAEIYAKLLSEAASIALRHYANAVELKKRLGRGEIEHDAIPEGITDALQRDPIDRVVAELNALHAEQTTLRQSIQTLERPDETYDDRHALLANMLDAIGKRLDILRELEKLEQDFHIDKKSLSELERKALEQNILRRMGNDQRHEEKLLALVASGAGENLTDMLKIYYDELLDLERKEANLNLQKNKTETLVGYVEEEKASIQDLAPLLQRYLEDLETLREEAWVRVQASLDPQNASALIKNFESTSGRTLPLPPAVDDAHKPETIARAAKHLLDKQQEIEGVEKWIALFEAKLSSPTGVAEEVGAYQDQLGEIDARTATLERRIHRLTGHPYAALGELSEEEKPRTEAEVFRFLHGEIGALRDERLKIRAGAATWVLAEVGAIIVGAFLLSSLIGSIIRRLIRRARGDGEAAQHQQAIFVLSFINGFFKLMIWISAFVLVLSALGFNIGAILAGLGIGGLALAMAANQSLANILGGIMIFIEKPFKIGDTIKVGGLPVGKVMDMTWRTTRLVDSFDYHMNIPNSDVAGSNIINYSGSLPSGDYISVYVSPDHHPDTVIRLMDQALQECDKILQDQAKGTMFAGVEKLEDTTAACYWPWWYIPDYNARYGSREQVWLKIAEHLKRAGISLAIEKEENADSGEREPVSLQLSTPVG